MTTLALAFSKKKEGPARGGLRSFPCDRMGGGEALALQSFVCGRCMQGAWFVARFIFRVGRSKNSDTHILYATPPRAPQEQERSVA